MTPAWPILHSSRSTSSSREEGFASATDARTLEERRRDGKKRVAGLVERLVGRRGSSGAERKREVEEEVRRPRKEMRYYFSS
jgi:hypothetical protein